MSPRTKDQFAKIRKQSFDLIAESALTLFAKHGFHSTSVDLIARTAGVSKGLIYNYFDNKEDLLRHIVESAIEKGDHLVDKAQRNVGDPLEKLFYIIDDLMGLIKSNPTYWKLIFKLSMHEEIAKRFEKTISAHATKNMSQLSGLLEELDIPDHELEAMALVATFDGMLMHFIQLGEEYPLEAVAEHLKRRLKKLCQTSTEE